jgi:TRAP-type uncharacterized transport system fused permease subunit
VVVSTLSTGLGLLALSSLVVGYLFRDNRVLDHILILMSTVLLFFPHILANVVGGLIFLSVAIFQKKQKKEKESPQKI